MINFPTKFYEVYNYSMHKFSFDLKEYVARLKMSLHYFLKISSLLVNYKKPEKDSGISKTELVEHIKGKTYQIVLSKYYRVLIT